jgi:hypothetical protein
MKCRLEYIPGKGAIRQVYAGVSDIGTRRGKMEQKSSEKTKPKAKKIRFRSNPAKIERVFFAKDFYGCMLVVPEGFGTSRILLFLVI